MYWWAYHLPRRVLLPIMPKHPYKTALFSEKGTIIGYVSSKEKPVLYGKYGNYNRLYFWGMIK